MIRSTILLLSLAPSAGLVHGEAPDLRRIEAIAKFDLAVGRWECSGISNTSSGWNERIECLWGFRESDGRPSLDFFFDDGRHFERGLLTYDLERELYRFVAEDRSQRVLHFEGTAEENTLRLDRVEQERDADGLDRLEIKLARGGKKLLYELETRKGRSYFESVARVEGFREGPNLATLRKNPRCVVTGGLGRIERKLGDHTFFVACPGCHDEFLTRPNRYLQRQE